MGVRNARKKNEKDRKAAWSAALVAGATLAWLTTARAQSRTNFDLTIDAARLQGSVVFRTQNFKPSDCAIVEGCVGGPGKRNLMKFDVATPNVGTEDLVLGSPTDGKPYLVQYFERNRLEYHPELGEAYRVSLGLLGAQVLQSRGWLP